MANSVKGIQLALFGGIGALAPDILFLYSKRWTMPSLEFEPVQYAVISLFYVLLAALVATIYPYGKIKTKFKAFCVGVSLPIIISGASSFFRATTVSTRGSGNIQGTLLDLISLI